MPLRYPCPSCSREMLLEKMHEGFEVPCPACGHRFLVAAGTVDAAAADTAGDAPPLRADSAGRPLAGAPATSEDTMALVLGIIGLVLCNILSPVAWYLGHKARQEARRAGRQPSGNATAGWILGIVGTVLLLLGGCFMVVYLGAFATLLRH